MRTSGLEPSDAIAHGLGLLTEDRKLTGIMGVLPVRDNMTIASLPRFSPRGILNKRRMDEACRKQREALAIKTPSLAQLIKLLSGGNQQKVLVSRWLLTTPDILMIDEPTRGIDVGAKAEIHRLMSTLAGQGKAILMVSSEMPEILGMSDRVLVMHEGRLTGDRFHIAPFIATLGMMTAARGLALIYSDGRPISKLDPGFNFLGQGSILGIPVPIFLLVVVALGAHLMLNDTRFVPPRVRPGR